jgi:hypothetical protein
MVKWTPSLKGILVWKRYKTYPLAQSSKNKKEEKEYA